MTLVAAPAPSWVKIDLDTTPPVLVLEAPAQVEPPDDLIVLVKANEDLGPVAASFHDAYDQSHPVGIERVGARLLAIRLPTMDLASGGGDLTVFARDKACNLTASTVTIVVLRPRAFDVVLEIGPTLEAEISTDSAFEASIEIGQTLDTQLTLDHAHEVETTIEPALDATLEIT